MERLVSATGDPYTAKGVIIGPVPPKMTLYANTVDNVRVAVHERIERKHVTPHFSKADRTDFGHMVGSLQRDIFTTKRIAQWADLHPTLPDCKSKKWTDDRVAKAADWLLRDAEVRYDLTAMIKLEASNPDKAPRLLVADGDKGQLMALMVVKCMEDILFDVYAKRSIKHAAKGAAVDAASDRHRHRTYDRFVIEGDGSAWDATMSDALRGITENPLIAHIGAVLKQLGMVPDAWFDAHEEINNKKALRAKLKGEWLGSASVKLTLRAIRRSGHRGTSVLNWLANFTIWAVVLYGPNAWQFVAPDRTQAVDRWGKTSWTDFTFEGDDSLLSTSSNYIGERKKELERMFTRYGLNMKLVDATATGSAEFCGWRIRVDQHGTVPASACPDLKRAVKNAGVSVSGDAVRAVLDGDDAKMAKLAAASYLCRAHDFAGRAPTVSGMFYGMAASWDATLEVEADHEMRMRTGLETSGEVCDAIRSANAGAIHDEADYLTALGWPTTTCDLLRVVELGAGHWTTSAAFHQGIPSSWV